MNKTRFLSSLLFLTAVLLTAVACSSDSSSEPSFTAPTFNSPVIQDIQATTATVTCTVKGDGLTEYGIAYATTSDVQKSGQMVKATSKDMQVTLTGLTASTLYYVLAYAKGDGKTFYSNAVTFNTANAAPENPDNPENPGPQPLPAKCVGGDISMLPKYEAAGVVYKDKDGKTVSDVLAFFKQQGMNSMRVRLFVDPSNTNDKAVCQDLSYVKKLGKRIKDAGMAFLLDFHYSDTWADPGNQWTPAEWASLNDSQLQTKIYDYTKDCLTQLIAAGATPDLIQTGNEISYGMLWGASGTNANRCYTNSSDSNWNRFFNLLKQAGKACREVCPDAKIVLHSERVPKPNVLTDYFDRMKNNGIDYDIIGLSYYPDHHGDLNTLETAINTLEGKNYGKDIMIVETGYSYKWSIGTEYDYTATYPYSEEGQRKFTADLVAKLNSHSSVKGLYWWWPEDNGNKNVTSGWWNAALYNHDTGKPYAALYELQNFK